MTETKDRERALLHAAVDLLEEAGWDLTQVAGIAVDPWPGPRGAGHELVIQFKGVLPDGSTS